MLGEVEFFSHPHTCESHTAGQQLHQVAQCSAGEPVGTSQSYLPLGFPAPLALLGCIPVSCRHGRGSILSLVASTQLDPRELLARSWPLPRIPSSSLPPLSFPQQGLRSASSWKLPLIISCPEFCSFSSWVFSNCSVDEHFCVFSSNCAQPHSALHAGDRAGEGDGGERTRRGSQRRWHGFGF